MEEKEKERRKGYAPPRVEVYAADPDRLLRTSFGGGAGTSMDDEGGGGGDGGGAGTGTGENNDLSNFGTGGAKGVFGFVEFRDLWEE